MPENLQTEALIDACVNAGVAARLAHGTAIEQRRQANLRGALTVEDIEHLDKLDAAAERLSRSYVDAQRRLADANRVRFRERLDEVTHRIGERLGRPR
jgi:hypothetical protein